MDTQFLTYLMDQAVGVVIAVLLLTRIEKRLDQLIQDLEAFIEKLNKPL